MNKTNKILLIIIALLILIGGVIYVTQSNKIDGLQKQYKLSVLRGDSLVKVNDYQYSKLIADTLTKRDLNKIIDSLGLVVNDAYLVENINIQPQTKQGDINSVITQNDSILITDYYPNKNDFILKYNAKLSLTTLKGNSRFIWQAVPISIAHSNQKNGINKADIRLPKYIDLIDYDIQALPSNKPLKTNNFGVIGGFGYGNNYKDNSKLISINVGARFKDYYLLIQGNTNQEITGNILYEF